MFKIEILKKADSKIVKNVNALTAQLSLSLNPPKPISLMYLEKIIHQKNSHFLVVRDRDRIVGLVQVYLTYIPTGIIAEVEDLVVDESYRKWGLGPLLVQKSIDIAEKAGAKHINLRTNPKRLEANKMYQALGFSKMETNFYRINLPRS